MQQWNSLSAAASVCESYHSMVSGESKQGWIPTQDKTNILIAASRKPHFILKRKTVPTAAAQMK